MSKEDGRGKFVVKGDRTVFRDHNGIDWNEELLSELILSLKSYRKVTDALNYYADIADSVRKMTPE